VWFVVCHFVTQNLADSRYLENKKIEISLKTVWPDFEKKLCNVMHIIHLDLNGCSKIQIFKYPRWWVADILKNIKHSISTTV